MTTANQAKFVAVIGLIAGPYFIYDGMKEGQRVEKVEKEGVTVSATLESGSDRRTGKRSRSKFFEASFTPEGGSPVSKEFQVTSEFFTAHTNGDFIENPDVQVRYLKDDPTGSAIIVGGSKDNRHNLPIGIGGTVIGAGILGFFALRRKTV